MARPPNIAHTSDHVYDEVIVDRICDGYEPGRPPSRRETLAVVRRLYPAMNINQIAPILGASFNATRALVVQAFPHKYKHGGSVSISEGDLMDEGE